MDIDKNPRLKIEEPTNKCGCWELNRIALADELFKGRD